MLLNNKHIKKNRIKVKENLWEGNMGGDDEGVESSGTQPLLVFAAISALKIFFDFEPVFFYVFVI